MSLKKPTSYSFRLITALESRGFYAFVLALFVFEAAWIALSALYPQAFDEDFHFGLIKLYTHHWSPFLRGQPAGADIFGAVARDPSYFYHYLMSFPLRLFAAFAPGQAAQVIFLRLFDVGLFAVGLTLFKKVMARVGVSKALTNVTLLIFILIPIVPQLAAQVNYDDLLFPLTAWICLQTFNLTDQIRLRQPRFKTILILAITTILTTLVKYAFLPIALADVAFLLVITFRVYRHDLPNLWTDLKNDFSGMSVWLKIILPTLVIISAGLFLQRAGYNLYKYHSFVPNCSKVLNVQQCSSYSPWFTDYSRHQQKLAGQAVVTENIVKYAGLWFYWMWYRLFFAINGVSSNYYNFSPLPLPSLTAVILAAGSVLAVIKWRARLFYNNPYLLFLLIIILAYSASLFAKGYATYQYTAYLENMNGRYLVPILLPAAAIAGLALSRALKKSSTQKIMATAIVVVLFLEGGGLLNFLVRSDDSWYWPNSTVSKVNKKATTIAKHVVVKKN